MERLNSSSCLNDFLDIALTELAHLIQAKYKTAILRQVFVIPEVSQCLTDQFTILAPEAEIQMLTGIGMLDIDDSKDLIALFKLNHVIAENKEQISFSDSDYFRILKKLHISTKMQLFRFELIQYEEGLNGLFFTEMITKQNQRIKDDLSQVIFQLSDKLSES